MRDEAGVQAVLNQAVSLHQQGHLTQAEALYRQVLQTLPRQADALHLLGLLQASRGQVVEALALIGQAIEEEPGRTHYRCSLGNLLLGQGRLAEAEASYREASRLDGGSAEAWINLGNAQQAQGKLVEAEDSYTRALPLQPNLAELYEYLGEVKQAQGKRSEAEGCYRKATELKPDHAEAHRNLGDVLQSAGRLEEAVESYAKAIGYRSDHVEAYSNMGHALKELGRLAEAEASCREALRLRPDCVEALINLGNALQSAGRQEEAEASYRQALEYRPDCAEAWCDLGHVVQATGRLDEALAHYRRALSLKPDYAEAYCNLGTALNAQGNAGEAVSCYRQAIRLDPDHVGAWGNLGDSLHALGRHEEGFACYRHALALASGNPVYAGIHCNLIFALDMAEGMDAAILQAERKRWAATYADPLWVTPTFSKRRDPERPLRIGYISADFKQHSAATVFGAMLLDYDRIAFETYAYSNASIEDANTKRFRDNVTVWRTIYGQGDKDVEMQIRQDDIDILVDLSGFTAGNRLLVFARKPAPIQITAWGYIGGTGMRAMDIFFADSVIVPEAEKKYYAEEVRYLPNVISASFQEAFPDVGELPVEMKDSDALVYGSFNRLSKITEETYETWSSVLHANPSSCILLKTAELESSEMRAMVLSRFVERGIAANRITLLGKSSWYDHMAAFNRVDIGLDPYPHGGGVTTLEGLMMGVPVVTLKRSTVPGRLSSSILTTLGLEDWIAESEKSYVELALKKARDVKALSELRKGLRQRVQGSIIGDTVRYVKVVEAEYRKLWREWCMREGGI